MKLERLDLSGFKSFVDPVTLRFAGGITAIVGPNGCGKSNISDSVSWVLGEQSAKSLRGGTMEDVIFNGSEQRRPLGMAEVTLSLRVDPASAAAGGAKDGRVTIGRQVFRSGESKYRLNGKTVRLKDVKDLLMDTGLGIRAYSVIEQGKIGMILSGKPQERRKLLEEAAGITRYKARKRVAEVKLEEATANLLRLDDVISEVERALRSLKRQAGAARRYKERQTEYRRLLEIVLLGRWAALAAQLGELGERLAAATTEDAELAAALARDEAALARGREVADDLARALAASHQRQADLAATIEGRQELLKGARQTVEEIGDRVTSGRLNAQHREREAAEHRQALAELEHQLGELRAEHGEATAAVEEDRRRLAEAERALRDREARAAASRQALAEADAEVEGLTRRLQRAQLEHEKANYRRHHLEEEIGEHAGELEQAGEALAAARERAAGLRQTLAERAAEVERATATLEEILRREAEANEHRQALADRLTERRQRRQVLEQLGRAHAERRAALEAALAEAGREEPEFLERRLRAAAGWERGLDVYLGELTDAVLVEDAAAALDLARALAGGEEGGGATLLHPLADSPGDAAAVRDPAIVLPLGAALGLPEELARALPPAYLVEEPADAQRLAAAHPGAAFLSRRGVWARGGLLHLEGPRQQPGVLERESELAELAEAVPALEAEVEGAAATIRALVERRAEQAREKNRLEEAARQLRQDLAVAQARQQDTTGRHRRLESEHGELEEERRRLTAELARLAESQSQAEAALAAAHRSREERQGAVAEAAATLEAARERREALRAANAERRARQEVLAGRLESAEGEAARRRQALAEAGRQDQLWSREEEGLEHRRRELEQTMEKARRELEEALAAREGAADRVVLDQEKLDDHRADLTAIEERLAACRQSREETRSAIEELRVRRASLSQDAEHLRVTFRDEFHAEIEDTHRRAGSARDADGEAGDGEAATPIPPRDGAELARLEAELARVKEALERLGPVNVLAVEEYTEQEERHTFLTAQRADVADSVASLKRTIREINETSSERFRTTFEEVNVTFGETFQHLFRGGEAEMRLLDDEDLLESGIEIVARPPGKRLQNIMLLSGGEKALTAIALLFALFRTKPSPFCILDEVDAPLDDVNTLRFVEVLKEMSRDTQFLVITHNKLTMEAASTLYGVTMEERGVSKLVSVELDDVQPQPQPQEAAAGAA